MGIVDECKKVLKKQNKDITVNVFNIGDYMIITYLNGIKKLNYVKSSKDSKYDYIELLGSSINNTDSNYLDFTHKFVSLEKWLKKYSIEEEYTKIFVSRFGIIIDRKHYIYKNNIIDLISDTISLITTYSGFITVNGREKEMIDAYHDFENKQDIVSYRDVLTGEVSTLRLDYK